MDNEKKKTALSKLISLFEQFTATDVKLESQTLEDGTMIQYDSLEPGSIVNIVNEDGTVTPLGDGEYVIMEGILVIVDGAVSEVTVVDEVVVEEEVQIEQSTEETKDAKETEEVDLTKETTEEVVDEVEETTEVKMAKEVKSFETKLANQKTKYETKLAEQKAKYEEKILQLGEAIKESQTVILQEEVKKPMTAKEKIMWKIENNKNK